MGSEKFRKQLQQEAAQWESESLISSELYQQLAERYDFNSLHVNARDRFVTILVIVGGVLLGIGVITFVAANWQSIPRIVKVVLLLSLLVISNVFGFYLWRSPHHPVTHRPQWRNRLGHALFVFGALILGANLALMGQLFHQRGSAFGLCMMWGVGVIAMAYGIRLTSLAVIACALVNIGYWYEWVSFDSQRIGLPLSLLFEFMPLFLILVFLPLVYRCQSRLLFGLVVVGVGASLAPIILNVPINAIDPFGITVAIAVTLPVAFWWSYHDEFWHSISTWIIPDIRQPQETREENEGNLGSSSSRFAPIARSLSIIYLGGVFYVCSFHDVWSEYWFTSSSNLASINQVFTFLITDPNVLIIALLTLGFWVKLGWSPIGHPWRLTASDGVVLSMIVITGGVIIWDGAIAPSQILATMVFNSLLFLLSAGLMREGLADGDRRQFWFGLVLLILQILSRVFEYETELLLKSITFLLCGVGVIIIGLWFERYVRNFSPNSAQFNQSRSSLTEPSTDPDEEVSA